MLKWRAFVIVLGIVFFFSLTGVSAWSNTTFNNSLGAENLSFTGNQNITRWLDIPSGVSVINGSISLLLSAGNLFTISYNAVFGNNLIAYYTMDEVSGNVTDSTSYSNNGTVISVTQLNQTGKWNTALKINGSNSDNMTIPNSAGLNFSGKNFTISLWMNATSSLSNNVWITKGPGGNNIISGLWNDSGSPKQPGFIVYDAASSFTYIKGGNVTPGIFQHIVLNYNGSLNLFVNGTLVDSNDTFPGVFSNNRDIIFECSGSCGDGYIIDELGIWNRSLNSSEITELYNLTSSNYWLEVGTPDGTHELDILSSSLTTTGNLANVINNYLNTCVYSSGFCNVPFLFHSSVTATIQYLNLIFDNIGFTENSQTFNNITYETTQEDFVLNLTYDSTEYTSSSANLIWNGTSYAGTKAGTGNTLTFSKTLTMAAITSQQNKTFYWEILLTNSSGINYFNSTTKNQTVNIASLSYCGGVGGSVPYLNFTFIDEATGLVMNASNDLSDFDYWLSGGTVTQNYIATNTTTNPSYPFCFVPAHKDVVVDLTFKYAETGYPLRTFQYDDQTLTNTSTNQVLYLLPTASGIYSAIQMVDFGGSPIVGVQVLAERQFSGTWKTIEQGVSDSSGLVTFWVNPNFDHRITATKTGYTSAQVTIRPSQATYTLTLTGTVGAAAYNDTIEGVRWIIYPKIGTMDIGSKNFNVTFTSTETVLENCKMQVVNATNVSQVFASDTSAATNATSCYNGFDYTAVDDVNLFARLYVDTEDTDGYVLVNSDYKWIVIDIDKDGNYRPWNSISSFFTELRDLNEFGDTKNTRDFSRIMFFFVLTTIFIGLFTHFSGFEIQNPGISVLIIAIIILFASAGGFLTFDSGVDRVNPIMEQWGFFFIFAIASLGFMLNTIRRAGE